MAWIESIGAPLIIIGLGARYVALICREGEGCRGAKNGPSVEPAIVLIVPPESKHGDSEQPVARVKTRTVRGTSHFGELVREISDGTPARAAVPTVDSFR